MNFGKYDVQISDSKFTLNFGIIAPTGGLPNMEENVVTALKDIDHHVKVSYKIGLDGKKILEQPGKPLIEHLLEGGVHAKAEYAWLKQLKKVMQKTFAGGSSHIS